MIDGVMQVIEAPQVNQAQVLANLASGSLHRCDDQAGLEVITRGDFAVMGGQQAAELVAERFADLIGVGCMRRHGALAQCGAIPGGICDGGQETLKWARIWGGNVEIARYCPRVTAI